MEFTELAKNISVILGALALISGIRAWKREYIGKRKIELAEDTLMLFYQARDAIRDIRNPFGRIGEGSSRQKAEHETESETELLNRAYVIYERYQKQEDIFNKLQSTRYRFMARFGRENETPFIELNKILNEIFLKDAQGTLMKIITLHPLVIVHVGVCGSAVVKVIQKRESGDRDS